MRQRELDEAISRIRGDAPEKQVMEEAAARVASHLFASEPPDVEVDRIRGCSDFQALLPAYVNGRLTSARTLLVQDHLRECVPCRRERKRLEEVDGPAVVAKPQPARKIPLLAWATAATLVVGIGIGTLLSRSGVFSSGKNLRWQVASIEGQLYRMSGAGPTPVTEGAVLTGAEYLRTGRGSRAVLKAVNGGTFEVAESSDVSLSRYANRAVVDLQSGRLIVQASGKEPAFYASSGNFSVPVRNAVLSMNRGVKGSRLVLAKGIVDGERSGAHFRLAAGEQIATDGLGPVPAASEFRWSQNAGSYLALLGEISTLANEWQKVATPAARYTADLAQYVPANSLIYAALPNVGSALVDGKRLFDERLEQSEVLRQWWNAQDASERAAINGLVPQIASLTQYLGNEILLCITPGDASGHGGSPLLLARTNGTGLASYLQAAFPADHIQIATDESGISDSADGQDGGRLIVLLKDGLVAASPNGAVLKAVFKNPGQFTESSFYRTISDSYNAGVGYLFAVNLEQMMKKSVHTGVPSTLGANGVQSLVLEERKSAASGGAETRAELAFNGTRQGIASWLGTPGSMGSLDFVSPDATVAASFVMKNPRTALEELIQTVTGKDPRAADALSRFETATGLNVLDDIAKPLGSNVTFAIDGPLLPVPSWKVALEVNDSQTLERSIGNLIESFNREKPANAGTIEASTDTVNGQTFHILRNANAPASAAAIYYTFVDGYLLAGSSEANLLEAIQTRKNGLTLTTSPSFRKALPVDNYTSFSAVVYASPSRSLSAAAEQLKNSPALTPAQKAALASLTSSTTPGLICIYGEPDRIVAAGRGPFLGFDFGTLAGMAQGHPLLPMVASRVTAQIQSHN